MSKALLLQLISSRTGTIFAATSTAVLCISGLSSVQPASAATLKWTFQGVTFNDGGTATGSFDYNADTNTYSKLNFITSITPTFPVPGIYQSSNNTGITFSASPTRVIFESVQGNGWDVQFSPGLSNNGGAVPVSGVERVVFDFRTAQYLYTLL